MENNNNFGTRRRASDALSSSHTENVGSCYTPTPNGESAIARRVKDIIVEKLDVDISELNYNASFINDLGADSLDAVELIMEFEKAFGISIPDEQAERILTVGDAISYIECNH